MLVLSFLECRNGIGSAVSCRTVSVSINECSVWSIDSATGTRVVFGCVSPKGPDGTAGEFSLDDSIITVPSESVHKQMYIKIVTTYVGALLDSPPVSDTFGVAVVDALASTILSSVTNVWRNLSYTFKLLSSPNVGTAAANVSDSAWCTDPDKGLPTGQFDEATSMLTESSLTLLRRGCWPAVFSSTARQSLHNKLNNNKLCFKTGQVRDCAYPT
jgi:hypothetical protein